jgi:acetyl esterase/lipase
MMPEKSDKIILSISETKQSHSGPITGTTDIFRIMVDQIPIKDTWTFVALCVFTIAMACLIWWFSLLKINSVPLEKGKNGIRSKQEPFLNFNHPEKSFLDKFVSWIIPYLLPTNDLAQYPAHSSIDNDEMKKTLEALRNKMLSLEKFTFQISCKEWNTLIKNQNSDDVLISGTVTIPRNETILSSYGLVPPPEIDQVLSSRAPPEDNAPELYVDITCPFSAIKSGIELEQSPGSDDDVKQLKENGFRSFKPCKLQDIVFSDSAHLLLWFHGGGFTLGSARDGDVSIGNATKISQNLLNRIKKTTEEEKESPSPSPSIVVLSVNYRLSPENPFPAAIIDGLSSSSFLVKTYPSLPLHVAGISAGGNLAAVVGLETYRTFPGSVTSIMADAPMTQPRTADSLSYHLNSKSSGCCPVGFLRWSWSAYLQLGEKQDGSIDYHTRDGLQKSLDCSAWSSLYSNLAKEDSTQGNGSLFWRLISPQADLPCLKNDDTPSIFIATATADPLHDDGIALVKGLKEKSKASRDNIYHFEFTGSHALAATVDPKGKAAMINEWSKSFMPQSK